MTGLPLYVFDGEISTIQFGVSVSGAGDVNGDGFDDVIIGADKFSPPGGNWNGKAYVYSGQSGALINDFTGADFFYQFGYSVSGGGDANNDGFADVVIGTFTWSAVQVEGRAYVYYLGGLCGNFICGDANNDQTGMNILDLTFLVDYIFRGGPLPTSIVAADLDGSGGNPNIIDLTKIVDRIFRGAPLPTCGI